MSRGADRLVSALQSGFSGITHDAHGNMATVNGETHTYGMSDRPVATTK